MFSAAVASVVAVALEGGERDRVETELRAANRSLAQAAKAKSLFLANMSHEIRTPMNGVLGMTELLLRTSLDANQTRLPSNISQSASSLLTVINDVLDVSRMEAGKLELECRSFDLRACLENAVEVLSTQANGKGLELGLQIAPDVPAQVLGDSGRLRQICLNLIGNSVKFTERGEISLEVSVCSRGDDRVEIDLVFSDTGIGIDPARLDRVVSPYSQADSSIARRFGGSGLGLSICGQLAALMGGTMKITSQLGGGTTVALRLPFAASAQGEANAQPLAGRRIAVVGPAGIWRAAADVYARAAGADVDVASAPSEIAFAGIDAVLLDARLIEADRLTIAACRAASKDIRVVVVGPLAASESFGADGFVGKPRLPPARSSR
jgi:signal transduction histidine kinase